MIKVRFALLSCGRNCFEVVTHKQQVIVEKPMALTLELKFGNGAIGAVETTTTTGLEGLKGS